MPARWLTALSGERIAFAEVDMARTEELFGLPPAEIAALINNQSARLDVDPAMVTASQAESGARQLYLESYHDFAISPMRQVKSMIGTGKHATVNIEDCHDDMLVEVRFVSKCGRFSGKIDSYLKPTRVLDDHKFLGSFKIEKMLERGVEAEGKGYWYQLNFSAFLMRDKGYPVEKMRLIARPSDAGKLEKGKLAKLGAPARPNYRGEMEYDPEQPIVIEVPPLEREVVMARYEALWAGKEEARISGVPPGFCTSSETWGGKKCTQGWCAVADICQQLAASAGEEHPWLKRKEESAA